MADAPAFKPLTNLEYEQASRRAGSLEVCPTCSGGYEKIDGAGVSVWKSEGYKLNGKLHECDCERQLHLYARYLLAGIGTQYMRLDWADFGGVEAAKEMVANYVGNWKHFLNHGFGLTFAGKTQGVGKTWAAAHIGKELIKRRQTVLFMSFTAMVDAFSDAEKKRVYEARMRDTTLLILDDVWAGISERQTDYYALTFEVVIRHRTNFNLPTILTTNLTEGNFEAEFPRIYSLLQPKQMWIEMNGLDYRKQSSTAVRTAEMIANGEIAPIT